MRTRKPGAIRSGGGSGFSNDRLDPLAHEAARGVLHLAEFVRQLPRAAAVDCTHSRAPMFPVSATNRRPQRLRAISGGKVQATWLDGVLLRHVPAA